MSVFFSTDFPASSGSITTTAGTSWTYAEPKTACEPITISTPIVYPTPYMGYYKTFDELHESSWSRIIKPNKGGDENMRYLYEVILVNPKNNVFSEVRLVAKSETSALMKAYDATQFKNKINKTISGSLEGVDFDDLKTSCRVLMEWKKEKSLKKALETIKEAVE